MLASFYWAWSLHYSRVDIPSTTLFERNDFPFSITCQLQIPCLLRVGLCVHFPFSLLGFCLSWARQDLCVMSQSPWVHVNISIVLPGSHCCLGVFHHFWSYSLFSSSTKSMSLEWRGFVKISHSKFSPSVHIVDLCGFVLVAIYCKMFWWWGLRNVLKYSYSICH